MSDIKLFKNKKDCCACGACMNICPKSAITMQEDEYGFVYPQIDSEKCILCGMCKSVCAYQNTLVAEHEKTVYAAATKDDELIMKSASGGIFAQMAKTVLDDDGIVFGCSLEYENEALNPKHIWIDSEKDLYKLQGSKYVQSEISNTYKEVKTFLEEGKKVLFSGTPCQIHGLKSFLKKNYANLITIDIICHGVPSAKFFKEYISHYEHKYNGKIIDYKFRDKKHGQGMLQAFFVAKNNGQKKIVRIDGAKTGYMWEFLNSNTYRENCYECKYAREDRISDITIGDFWGVCIEHSSCLAGSEMNKNKGISCVILNTDKGKGFFGSVSDAITYFKSDIEKAAKHNEQLRHPSKLTYKRKQLLECYKNGGYKEFERYYKKDIGVKALYYWIKGILPSNVKATIRSIIKR